MLAKDGVLKVLDMGLTKAVDRVEDNLTGKLNADVILGTIDYLSPEQAMQSGADARSDVYSLGATLFTLLTGMAPYEGVPAKQKLVQHQFGAVPDVRTFCPEVPKELAAVVARMMAKKPDERYASAVDVIEALSPWLENGVADLALNLPSGIMKVPPREPSKTPTVSDADKRTRPDFHVYPRPRDGSLSRTDVRRKWIGAWAGVAAGALAVAGLVAALFA
jgi:serine/threonine protein kinase